MSVNGQKARGWHARTSQTSVFVLNRIVYRGPWGIKWERGAWIAPHGWITVFPLKPRYLRGLPIPSGLKRVE